MRRTDPRCRRCGWTAPSGSKPPVVRSCRPALGSACGATAPRFDGGRAPRLQPEASPLLRAGAAPTGGSLMSAPQCLGCGLLFLQGNGFRKRYRGTTTLASAPALARWWFGGQPRVHEMARVAKPSGIVAAAVWDRLRRSPSDASGSSLGGEGQRRLHGQPSWVTPRRPISDSTKRVGAPRANVRLVRLERGSSIAPCLRTDLVAAAPRACCA